jgi:hypothetical protein
MSVVATTARTQRLESYRLHSKEDDGWGGQDCLNKRPSPRVRGVDNSICAEGGLLYSYDLRFLRLAAGVALEGGGGSVSTRTSPVSMELMRRQQSAKRLAKRTDEDKFDGGYLSLEAEKRRIVLCASSTLCASSHR